MSFVKTISVTICLISSQVFGGASLNSVAQIPERKIASYFSQIAAKTFAVPGTAQKMMSSYYEQLRLRSPEGRWVSPELQNISEKLLPLDLNQQHFQKLLDDMISSAEQNPYLHSVLVQLDQAELGSEIDIFKAKVDKLGSELLAYAMVLENMTKAMIEDPTVFKSVYREFQVHKSELRGKALGHIIKFYSVEAVIEEFIKAHEEKTVPAGLGSFLIGLNISEAALLDVLRGNTGNASAAWSLIKHGPGDTVDATTGASPASFSKDGKRISLNMPFSDDWANLYASWNLGFVSGLKLFPFHAAKLLIPSVNNYHQEPGTYIYKRGCALYVHGMFLTLRNEDKEESTLYNFASPEIAKMFSDVNRKNADAYESKFDSQDSL